MNPRMNLKAISLVALAACLAAASVNAKLPNQTHKTEQADEPASASSSRTPSHPVRHTDASTTVPTAASLSMSQTSLALSSVTPGGPTATTRGRSDSTSSLDEILGMQPVASSSAVAAAATSPLPGSRTRTGMTPPAIDPTLLENTPTHTPTGSRGGSPVDSALLQQFQAAVDLAAQSANLLGLPAASSTAAHLVRSASVTSVSSQIDVEEHEAGEDDEQSVGGRRSVSSLDIKQRQPGRARSNPSSSAGSTTESSDSVASHGEQPMFSPSVSPAAVRVVSPAVDVEVEAEAAQSRAAALQEILDVAQASIQRFEVLLKRSRMLREEERAAAEILRQHMDREAGLRDDLEIAQQDLKSAQSEKRRFAALIEQEREEREAVLSNLERDRTVLQVQRENILESFSLLLVPDEREVSELDKVIHEAQKFSAETSKENVDEKRVVGYCVEDLSALREVLTAQDMPKKEQAVRALRSAQQVLEYFDRLVEEQALPKPRPNGSQRTITGLLTGMADTLRQMSPAYKLRELEESQRAWEDQFTNLQWGLKHDRNRNDAIKASIATCTALVGELEESWGSIVRERDLLESRWEEIRALSERAAVEVVEQESAVQEYVTLARQVEEELSSIQK